MEDKVKKKRKRKRPFNRILFIAVVSIYLLSRLYPMLGASGHKITIAQIGRLEIVVSTTGYVARDEEIYSNINDGDVTYFVADGEKVTKGQKLAEVQMKNIDPKTKEELEIINSRIKGIEGKQDEDTIFNADIQKLDNQINDITAKMQDAYKENDYSKINAYQQQLNELLEKKSIIAGEKSFAGKNLTQLQEQKKAIEERLQTSIQTIYSESPGVVAFGGDGLEDLLSRKSIENIEPQSMALIKNAMQKSNTSEEEGLQIRIIRDHRWSIIIELDNQQLEGIQDNKNLTIRKQGESRDYKAFVRKVIPGEDINIVILDLSEALEGYHSARAFNIDIVKERYEGLMLPNESITEVEGQAAVYRIDVNGFARYLPVKIIGSNREYSILQEGSFRKEIIKDGNPETVSLYTINLYDEVLLNGDKGIDGQKIR